MANTRSSIAFDKRSIGAIDTKTLDRNSIASALVAAGWKRLGAGAFSIALAHPEAPGVVIKVGQDHSHKRWVAQNFNDGFMNYVEAVKGTSSRYALRVYHAEYVNELKGGTYVAIVERCYRVKNRKAREKLHAIDSTSDAISYRWGTAPKCGAGYFLEYVSMYGKLDCHSKNVMARANGQLVVNDPLVIRL